MLSEHELRQVLDQVNPGIALVAANFAVAPPMCPLDLCAHLRVLSGEDVGAALDATYRGDALASFVLVCGGDVQRPSAN
eukprot:11691740-Alexandrium_andersonii.AAC.1